MGGNERKREREIKKEFYGCPIELSDRQWKQWKQLDGQLQLANARCVMNRTKCSN